jgi:predicted ABC-type ATPase
MPFGESQARRRYKFQVSAKAQKADLPCEPQELNVGFWILVSPNVYIIAGPNGAGKTTFAREFLPKYADCPNFVNADLIAQGLSPFSPETAAFRAGRLMLGEMEAFARQGDDFGFETTLSGRSHLNVIRGLKQRRYEVHVFYLWLPSVELALARVRGRVLQGGHDVPEAVVRRRFDRSISNFLVHYRQPADSWTLYDNTGAVPSVIASEERGQLHLNEVRRYNELVKSYGKND